MTHDSRRYHRTRRPPFARGYGMLGALGSGVADAAGTAGSALGSAAGAVGSGLESAAGALGTGAESALGSTGLSSIGQGLQSLFGSGGGEAGKLASLGQTVPAGVELAGPSSTFAGPGFMGGVMQGFTGAVPKLADPSAATSLGSGLGQLLSTLDQLNGQRQGGMSLGPIVRGVTGPIQGPRVVPGGSAQPGTGPIMKLLGIL